jgi:hypothetical protein
MKKVSLKTVFSFPIIIGILVFSSLWYSCKKDDGVVSTNDDQTTASRIDCDEEFDAVVNSAALGVVELAKSSSFRSLVHSKIQEEFDGDADVLLKTLASLTPNMVETMRQSATTHKDNIQLGVDLLNYKNFQTYTTTEKMNSVVNGFNNCSNTLYTQIYIPFFDKVDHNAVPVIVIGYEETDDCIAPAYQILPNGQVKVINVDENFAQNNLVWVVSVNERVTPSGVVAVKTVDESAFTNGGGVESREVRKIVKVDSVMISDKKECWLCGKAEVSFVALHANNCTLQGQAFAGYDFISIGNNDLNTWKKIAYSNGLSYMALDPENPLLSSECLGFVLYEKDHSKKKWENTWTFSTCASGGSVDLYYYSKQTPYGGSGISKYCYADFTNNTSWTQLPVFFSWTSAGLRLEAMKLN